MRYTVPDRSQVVDSKRRDVRVVEGARLESVFCAAQSWSASVHRPILPRSRHLPLASTDGSSTRNLNKTGVRLWTDRRVGRELGRTSARAAATWSRGRQVFIPPHARLRNVVAGLRECSAEQANMGRQTSHLDRIHRPQIGPARGRGRPGDAAYLKFSTSTMSLPAWSCCAYANHRPSAETVTTLEICRGVEPNVRTCRVAKLRTLK